jgi:hypothetical protein
MAFIQIWRRGRSGTMRITCLAATLVVLATTSLAHATQHLVRAGENWQHVEKKAKPGDEILLMPGRHDPVTLTGLHGTAERPIIIRGIDPKSPSVIAATRYGLRLIDSRHVEVSNIAIDGATINGIAIESAVDGLETSPDAFEPVGPLLLERITIVNTGPTGRLGTAAQRHAIHLRHVSRVRILDCRVDGWVGSGLEIVGGREITVVNSNFFGQKDRRQLSGIRVRAGAQRVRIRNCHFRNAGDQGVAIGAGSSLEDFLPRIADDAPPGSLYEALRVHVTGSIFEGGLCAIAFVNCDRAIVRNCTIVRPQRTIVSIRNDQTDPRFAGAAHCAFGSNIITWEPGDITSLAHIGRGAELASASLEQNLWWTPAPAADLEQLGPFPGTAAFPQITDVDPELDENLVPESAAASAFGANPR